MAKGGSVILLIITLVILSAGYCQEVEEDILLREEFNSIEGWEPLYFPKITNHSTYSIESDPAGSYLKAESNASASALIYRKTFNVYEFPNIGWRWMAKNVCRKGDARTKEGDDYPVRIYIIFKYDPERAGFFEKLKYSTAKLLYGEYPPHSALNYIWANREHEGRIMTSTYEKKSKMIVKRGPSDVGTWHAEEVNALRDYREAFGEDPPDTASIAIMNDSDNTGEQSVSYIDYIVIYKEASAEK